MGNIHVKLYEIWTRGSGGDVIERKSLRTTDGRRTKTDDTSSHSAFGFFLRICIIFHKRSIIQIFILIKNLSRLKNNP